MPTPETHSMLGPSSAERWIHCPPSAEIAWNAPDEPSEYAAAGTLAHAIGELKARKHFKEPMGPRKYSNALKKLKADPNYDSTMDAATDEYLDALKEEALRFTQAPDVMLETRVDYPDIAPGGFGTADCLLMGDDTITVCDYKNGTGIPVDPERNPQMMLYAYGTLQTYGLIYGDSIQKVRLVIIQPHSGGVKTWETTRTELERWAHEVVAPAAALAAEGKGDFCPGDWCDSHFCPARATCRARVAHMLGQTHLEGQTLTDAEVGDVLTRARGFAKWLKSLEDYAFQAAMSGNRVPGWKLVAGRQSREWTGGADAAFAKLLAAGIPEAMLYERKPVTPPGLEKALGKKTYQEQVAEVVTIRPGKPTLVEETDKRPEWTPATAAFEVVT